MKAQEIIEQLEAQFPLRYAADWDNPGLLAGRREKEVNRVYIALDATDEVVEAAVRQEADLLLTHHPLIFHSIRKVNEDDIVGRRLVQLIQNDITYYAMHTNYDVAAMGQLAAQRLGIRDPEVLMETWCDPEDPGIRRGYGKVGDLNEAISAAACARLVKERFALPDVRIFGDLEKKVQRVAISPGSGKGMGAAAAAAGADILITGDIDHHEGIDTIADGMVVIDAGHYGLEHIFIQDVREYVQSRWNTLEVHGAGICQPFTVM